MINVLKKSVLILKAAFGGGFGSLYKLFPYIFMAAQNSNIIKIMPTIKIIILRTV